MNLPSASPKENMQTPASIRAMPASRAERSSVATEIFLKKFIDRLAVLPLFAANGHSNNEVADARPCPATHLSVPRCFKDVDARHKPRMAVESIAAASPTRYR